MAKRNEDREKAYKLYKEGNKLIDISKKLDIPEGTIRSWKNRYKWDATVLQKDKDKKRNVATKKNNKPPIKSEPVLEEVQELMGNTELTDKQRLFCIYYPQCFNATKAYQKAYGCSYNTAMVEGFRLLRKPKVRDEIEKLKQNKFNRAMLSEDDIFQKYLDIAFADTKDYSEFGRQEVPMINKGEVVLDKEGNPITYRINYVSLKDSDEVDGSLISEISQGKDGIKIKLLDKMKALEWLANHKDLLTTEQKEKLKIEQAKVKHQEDNQEKDDVLKNMLEGLKNEL